MIGATFIKKYCKGGQVFSQNHAIWKFFSMDLQRASLARWSRKPLLIRK